MSAADISFTVYKGSENGSIVESTYKRGPLKDDEILVAVTASGLCGTDMRYKTKDMALGHEGAGVVKEVGPSSSVLKVGDRVGWGYLHMSCGHCEQCTTGQETYCPERHLYGMSDLDQGSFATAAVWSEKFLFKIPDGLSDEEAAPLMCGGATVFNALRSYNVQPTSRVGIIGVGGLGHLAIQFASKMGCDTLVFSGTNSKKEEATKLGASQFFAVKDKKELDIGRKIDALMVTTSALPDWDLYLPLMNSGAKVFPLGVSGGNLEVPYIPMLLQGLTIQFSLASPRAVHNQMLEFAARHGIKPVTMSFDLDHDGIEKAMKVMEDGKMRYRGVLVQRKPYMQ